MNVVTVRFYEELNDYLPPEKRKRDSEFCFGGRTTVGEMLERHGIPKGEVDLVLLNGHGVDFERELRDGDRVSVYPVFERFDIGDVTRLRDKPLRHLKFVADQGLGRTAERLSDLGFDVRWGADLDAEEVMAVSREEKRILLTPSADVAESGQVTHVLHVAPGPVEDQVRGILEALNLRAHGIPPGRRGECELRGFQHGAKKRS